MRANDSKIERGFLLGRSTAAAGAAASEPARSFPLIDTARPAPVTKVGRDEEEEDEDDEELLPFPWREFDGGNTAWASAPSFSESTVNLDARSCAAVLKLALAGRFLFPVLSFRDDDEEEAAAKFSFSGGCSKF